MESFCNLTPTPQEAETGSFRYFTPDGIGVVHHNQIMLVPVLTINRYDPVNPSMRLPTGKGYKETGNGHALPASRMLWNCQKDSEEFYWAAIYIKACPVPEKEGYVPADRIE